VLISVFLVAKFMQLGEKKKSKKKHEQSVIFRDFFCFFLNKNNEINQSLKNMQVMSKVMK